MFAIKLEHGLNLVSTLTITKPQRLFKISICRISPFKYENYLPMAITQFGPKVGKLEIYSMWIKPFNMCATRATHLFKISL